MTSIKLDRLSALFEGLSPQVSLTLVLTNQLEITPPIQNASLLYIFLLTQGSAILESNDHRQTLETSSLMTVRPDESYRLRSTSPSGRFQLIQAEVLLTGPSRDLFLAEFNTPRIFSQPEDNPTLLLAKQIIITELDSPRCGHPALLQRAGDILFIGLLRHLVAHPDKKEQGLFNGLADPRIAKAIVAMHQQPSNVWSIDRLAQEAGMSRSAFSSTFRNIMRITAGKYLTTLRLAIAQQAVATGKGLKEAARRAGYTNTSALSRALGKTDKT